MKKLSIDDSREMKIAIQQEIQRSDDSRYDHRLHGVMLVASGRSCYEVAELFGRSPRSIQMWVQRFNQSGFAGLQDLEKTGRPSALNERLRAKLGKHLRKSPKSFGYNCNQWDGKVLSRHLSDHFNVELGVRQCQRLFHEFGFRYRKPRPVIAKFDPAKEGAYKKTAQTSEKPKD